MSEVWTRVAPLYTEVSSCQRGGLECAPLYTEVSSVRGLD